ncbi:MAG TPA: hypothetical protein VGC61_02105 [Pyrinomonadaceae bacterium]|jgi:hypothetical protein
MKLGYAFEMVVSVPDIFITVLSNETSPLYHNNAALPFTPGKNRPAIKVWQSLFPARFKSALTTLSLTCLPRRVADPDRLLNAAKREGSQQKLAVEDAVSFANQKEV